MMQFPRRTAVINGAASGFGRGVSLIAARLGMNLVMADLQQDALDASAQHIRSLGAQVLPFWLAVSKGDQVEALASVTRETYGVPHLVLGVAHGVRVFTSLMLAIADADPEYVSGASSTPLPWRAC